MGDVKSDINYCFLRVGEHKWDVISLFCGVGDVRDMPEVFGQGLPRVKWATNHFRVKQMTLS